jgi:pectinesterase
MCNLRRFARGVIGIGALLALGAAGRADLVVAADGSGQYKTVQEAVAAAPPGTAEHPTVIRIKQGIYQERVYIPPEKPFLRMIGEDAAKTVLTHNLYASMPGEDGKPIGTFRTASTRVDADDFAAENMTFENSAGPVGQALAIRLEGDRIAFRNCRFLGWQDTILDNRGRHYYDRCSISGSVDFIFGAGTAVFDHCTLTEIRKTGGVLTAPSTPQDQPYGFVFLHCRLLAAPGVRTDSVGLMRPWRPYGQSAFLHCVMDAGIKPQGWEAWNGREKTCRALEYDSRTPEDKPVDVSGRSPWSRRLTEDEAARFTIEKVLGGWNPQTMGKERE